MAPHRPTHARSPPHRAERSAELQVVFDEYHFGKFVNGYITGEYFFDIHPPLGKLLLCLVARMGGYDGSQSWDKIGVDIPPEVNLLGLRGALTRTRTRTLALTLTLTLTPPEVNLLALRGAPALQGALLVPLMFGTARALGISTPGALLGACGVLLDGYPNPNRPRTRTRTLSLTLTRTRTLTLTLTLNIELTLGASSWSRASC